MAHLADTTPALIRAAGGVLRRTGARGVEVCLVHRPRYDDWSLPKGKLHAAEPPLAAAVREVYEETGVRAALLVPLPPARYLSRNLPKVVEYWVMRVLVAERFEPGPEVDALRWLPVPEALSLLSYPHDAAVLRGFAAMPAVSSVVVLIRHGSAGKRGTWPGPDRARPLDDDGAAQARRLAGQLALFAPAQLVSASPRRCVATLAPLAAALDLPIQVDTAFDESADLAVTGQRLRELGGSGLSTVVCSQRGVIPDVVAALNGGGEGYPTPTAGGWILPFTGDAAAGAYPLP